MGLRDTLNNNSAVVTIAAVALLVVALGIVFVSMGVGGGAGPQASTQEKWFIDTTTNKLFKGPAIEQGPIESPEGNEGVTAMVYTCADSCGGHDLTGLTPEEVESKDLFIGYLQRMSKSGQKQMEEMKKKSGGDDMGSMMMMEMMGQFMEVREVGSKKWYGMATSKMRDINTKLQKRCPNRRFPKPCAPGA